MTQPVNAWEIALQLRGLEWAYERCAEAHQAADVPDPVRAPLATGEFIGYACALDEWLSGKNSGYKTRRDQDPDGRLLLGLRFARDRHVHQASLTAVTAFTLQWSKDADGNLPGPPVLHPAVFAWRHLSDVTEPTDGRESKGDYQRRRAAYEAHLAGRPALPSLATAQRFLSSELRACGVE